MSVLIIFITIAGFVVGLGAVIVIDWCGFLGRTSPYWSETTIRVHKVTKPLIWLGTLLIILGTSLMYRYTMITRAETLLRFAIIGAMVLNGCFLSFIVSPYLLRLEKEGRAKELLPKGLQIKIMVSFVVSFTSWWGLLWLIVRGNV
jgi:hypothetical protein